MPTYSDASDVNALVPSWDGSANPTSTQVGAWQADAYSKINRALINAGYDVPVAFDAALYPELTGLEALYAAAYTLRALGIDTVSGDSEDRSEVWLADFYARLADLANSNLSLLGVTLLPSTTPNASRRLRTRQMRRVDGYSRHPHHWRNPADPYPGQGDYTCVDMPTE